MLRGQYREYGLEPKYRCSSAQRDLHWDHIYGLKPDYSRLHLLPTFKPETGENTPDGCKERR